MNKMLRSLAAAALAAAASTAGAQETLQVGANIGNVPWEFQDDSGRVRRLRGRPCRRRGRAPGRRVRDRQHSVQRPVLGGAVGADRHRDLVDHDHRRTPAIGDLRPALLRQRPVADRRRRADRNRSTRWKARWWASTPARPATCGRPTPPKNTASPTSAAMRDWRPRCSTCKRAGSTATSRDIPALLYYTKDKPDLNVVQRIQTGEKYSMMFAKDAELASRGEQHPDRAQERGLGRRDLHEKWFGVGPRGGDVDRHGHGHAGAQ